jgi:hypothetical protein
VVGTTDSHCQPPSAAPVGLSVRQTRETIAELALTLLRDEGS